MKQLSALSLGVLPGSALCRHCPDHGDALGLLSGVPCGLGVRVHTLPPRIWYFSFLLIGLCGLRPGVRGAGVRAVSLVVVAGRGGTAGARLA